MLRFHHLRVISDLDLHPGRSLINDPTTTPAPPACSLSCASPTYTIPSANVGLNISFNLADANACVVDSICAPWHSVVTYSWTAPRTCAGKAETNSFQFADTVLAVLNAGCSSTVGCDDAVAAVEALEARAVTAVHAGADDLVQLPTGALRLRAVQVMN